MGRRSKWEEYVKPNLELIKAWALDYEDIQIAKMLGVGASTFSDYKVKYPELREALKNGRQNFVAEAKLNLMKLCRGFHYEESKGYRKGKDQVVVTEVYRKYVPPNIAAINLALKNYDRDNWKNDPAAYELRKEELELRKQLAESGGDWVSLDGDGA